MQENSKNRAVDKESLKELILGGQFDEIRSLFREETKERSNLSGMYYFGSAYWFPIMVEAFKEIHQDLDTNAKISCGDILAEAKNTQKDNRKNLVAEFTENKELRDALSQSEKFRAKFIYRKLYKEEIKSIQEKIKSLNSDLGKIEKAGNVQYELTLIENRELTSAEKNKTPLLVKITQPGEEPVYFFYTNDGNKITTKLLEKYNRNELMLDKLDFKNTPISVSLRKNPLKVEIIS